MRALCFGIIKNLDSLVPDLQLLNGLACWDDTHFGVTSRGKVVFVFEYLVIEVAWIVRGVCCKKVVKSLHGSTSFIYY